jgi:DNA-binding transcriptional ArsR family regulator
MTDDMDRVFKALADPKPAAAARSAARRRGSDPGRAGRGLVMTRQAVSQHLALLEAPTS